jgi:hypothetical protein
MEVKKDLNQLIVEAISTNGKKNCDEVLFYLATTENPYVDIGMGNPLSPLECLVALHNRFHDLVDNEEVEFEGVSSALGMSGVLTINISQAIPIKTLLNFKTYTIGFEEENPQAALLLNLEYNVNAKKTSSDVVSCNLKELY